jgi:F-type H+-transporting ATPase subunit delta|tara:strand:- start:451 stop:1014 length:564 start_codon:yes stop_codon:yes gene_type:complete
MAKDLMASKIATPYADALLDVAKSTSSIHTITSDVNNLRDLLASTKMLKDYLNNPLAGVKAKREIIEKIISPEVSLPMSNFLFLLADRKRINYLETITERYLELVYDLANIKIVEVTSANQISEEQQQLLTEKLQSMTNAKEIKLLITLDSTLIGGFLIKTNSQVIDLSIKGQIKELASHLDSVVEF